MRIIDYYNIFAALILGALVLVSLLKKAPAAMEESGIPRIKDRAFYIAGTLFLLLGCILRLYHLASLPAGLNQDEAAIGYEAFLLATYGVNKMGHPWPVYPSTFGSGGGSPLMIYFNVLATRLFGVSPFVLRAVCAVAGCVTLVLFALLASKLAGDGSDSRGAAPSFALAALTLSLAPWHIVMSRWTKEPNMVPFFEVLATLLLFFALRSGTTLHFILASVFHALCLYAYGAANIIIPLHLLFTLPYCLYHKRIRPLQILYAGIAFVVILIPLIAYYAVNYLGLPELITPWFSLEKLTFNRLNTVFIFSAEDAGMRFLQNLKILFLNLTFGFEDGDIANYVPGYATLYRFLFPVTLLGLWMTLKAFLRPASADLGAAKEAVTPRAFSYHILPLSLFAASALYSLSIDQTISRDVFLYLPLTYFAVTGFDELLKKRNRTFIIAALLFLLGAASFLKDYFTRYNTLEATGLRFYNGYIEAVRYADAACPDGTVYCTDYNINSPDMMALYAALPDPDTYRETVVYDPRPLEFVTLLSFDRFVFGLPQELEKTGWDETRFAQDAFVVHDYEAYLFEGSGREQAGFGDYTVILPAVQ